MQWLVSKLHFFLQKHLLRQIVVMLNYCRIKLLSRRDIVIATVDTVLLRPSRYIFASKYA